MAVQRILQLGDPLLRQRSMEVADHFEAQPVFAGLRDTLHEFQRTHGFGRGISAVQIGVLKRLLYIEFQGAAYSMRNPRLAWRSDESFCLWDDCFSFPDLLVYLERARRVRVTFRDEQDSERTIEAEGPLSELLQHELDHLDGILAIDRAIDRNSFCTREEYNRRRRGVAGPASATPIPLAASN